MCFRFSGDCAGDVGVPQNGREDSNRAPHRTSLSGLSYRSLRGTKVLSPRDTNEDPSVGPRVCRNGRGRLHLHRHSSTAVPLRSNLSGQCQSTHRHRNPSFLSGFKGPRRPFESLLLVVSRTPALPLYDTGVTPPRRLGYPGHYSTLVLSTPGPKR